MPLRPTTILAVFTLVLAGALTSCGGDEEEPATSTESAATEPTGAGETGSCTAVEDVHIQAPSHSDRDFVAADYATNPPAGGDHNPAALQGGQFYAQPQPLGEAVHLLEHGGVIGWTNELDPAEQEAVEAEFGQALNQGYYQLAVVENPELEVPFALSSWGFLQRCDEADPSVIAPFIEQYYAPPASGESLLACQGEARRLPPCRAQ